jgi:hypothetical protein
MFDGDLPETNCDLINLIRLRATGIRSLAHALHKGGVGVRCMTIGAGGNGTRPGFFVYVTRRRRDGVGRQSRPVSSPIPLRDLTARDRTSNLPTMMVRRVVGAMTRHSPRHRSCVLPDIADGRDGVSRRTRPVPAMPLRPLLVGTPTRALAAPSEMPPAGRSIALTPP